MQFARFADVQSRVAAQICWLSLHFGCLALLSFKSPCQNTFSSFYRWLILLLLFCTPVLSGCLLKQLPLCGLFFHYFFNLFFGFCSLMPMINAAIAVTILPFAPFWCRTVKRGLFTPVISWLQSPKRCCLPGARPKIPEELQGRCQGSRAVMRCKCDGKCDDLWK